MANSTLNLSIKLRAHSIEVLAQLALDQTMPPSNLELKIVVQQCEMEIKKLKKLVLSLEHELEQLKCSGSGSNRSRKRGKMDRRAAEAQTQVLQRRCCPPRTSQCGA